MGLSSLLPWVTFTSGMLPIAFHMVSTPLVLPKDGQQVTLLTCKGCVV